MTSDESLKEQGPAGNEPRPRFATLGQRVAVAAAGIPLMAGGAWLGGWWLFGLVLGISLLGYREFSRLLDGRRAPFGWYWGTAGVPLALLHFQVPGFPPAAVVGWFLVLLVLSLFNVGEDRLRSPGMALLGVAYVSGLMGHLLLLRGLRPEGGFLLGLLGGGEYRLGFWALMWTMALVWIYDTGAYFAGLLLGRHPLAPAISPKKTVEGLLGGTAVTVPLAILLAGWWRLPFGAGHAAALSLLVVVFGNLGDLVESGLKRAAGIKDSGDLLPGHGGVLDRFDSLMFAAPAVYWYIKIVLQL